MVVSINFQVSWVGHQVEQDPINITLLHGSDAVFGSEDCFVNDLTFVMDRSRVCVTEPFAGINRKAYCCEAGAGNHGT
jgi:hypothetical protein